MVEDRGFAAVLPRDGQVEDAFVAGLLEKLAHRPDDPEGLVGVAGVVVGIPGQNRVSVSELVAQAFQNLRLCFFRAVIQERHSDLQIVPHALLSHDAEVHLLFQPQVHDPVEFFIGCLHRQRRVFLTVGGLGFFQCGALRVLRRIECGGCLCFLDGFRCAEDQADLPPLAGQQRQLVLQHRPGDEERPVGVRTILAGEQPLGPLIPGGGSRVRLGLGAESAEEGGQIAVKSKDRLRTGQIPVIAPVWREGVGRAAVDAVQLLVKACLDAAVHLIVARVGEAVQREAHRGKDAEHPGAVAGVLQPQRPALTIQVGGHKDAPLSRDAVPAGADRAVTDGVGAGVALHLLTQRAEAQVPALAALLIPEVEIPRCVPVEHAHVGFLVQAIAAPVPDLGDLGAVALFVPEVVVPIARRLRVADDAGAVMFGEFKYGLAERPGFVRHISPRSQAGTARRADRPAW